MLCLGRGFINSLVTESASTGHVYVRRPKPLPGLLRYGRSGFVDYARTELHNGVSILRYRFARQRLRWNCAFSKQ